MNKTKTPSNHMISRRSFLKAAACGVITSTIGNMEIANATVTPLKRSRSLLIHNLHTEEQVELTYFESGQYISGALNALNYLLRDHRSGDICQIDPALLDLLYDLQFSLGGNKLIQVISAYRSPKTNTLLRKKSSGVALKSLHMQGKAIDIRIAGINSKVIQQASIALARGGVGYYRRSDFVHIDTGNVRYW